MLAKVARLGVLAAGVAISVASTTSQGHTPQYQPGVSYAPPPTPGAYSCALLVGARTRGTLCLPTLDRCERERHDAERDGAQTQPCLPQAPVSCFQIAGDPNPSMEMCGATAEDCDLWRRIDQDRNGRTGSPCEWRHGELGPPRS
jgi:hypothetical protein